MADDSGHVDGADIQRLSVDADSGQPVRDPSQLDAGVCQHQLDGCGLGADGNRKLETVAVTVTVLGSGSGSVRALRVSACPSGAWGLGNGLRPLFCM